MIVVGVLIDSEYVPAWQKAIISFLESHTNFSISFIAVNENSKNSIGKDRLFYRLLRKIDRSLFKTSHNLFERYNLFNEWSGMEKRTIAPKQTKFKDELRADDIAWIQSHQPDILIRFGFRILTGEILNVARYGVWSLHHGDSAVNRGGPPAFWEVVNKEPVTGVTLQVLSEKLDAGQVLGKAYCRTNLTSFNRNQQSVYAAGIELFCSRLNDFARLGPDKFFRELPPSNNQFAKALYRDPDNIKALQIGLTFWWRRMLEWMDKLLFVNQWIIVYHQDASNPFAFAQAKKIAAKDLTDWADPFLYSHQGNNYLFFESLAIGGRGEILCLALNGTSSTPQRVLKEDYHLSYPTITEHEGKLYLMAESGAAKMVCLYECVEFPLQWKKLKPILEGQELYDPTLHFHEGFWYLFATCKRISGGSTDSNLHIYFSKDLFGEWSPHPLNPITQDVRRSRPAGKIFWHKDKLVRPAQIGAPLYGYGVKLMEILKLSPIGYEEQLMEELLPWPGIRATHTYTAINGWFASDAQVKRFRFFK